MYIYATTLIIFTYNLLSIFCPPPPGPVPPHCPGLYGGGQIPPHLKLPVGNPGIGCYIQ